MREGRRKTQRRGSGRKKGRKRKREGGRKERRKEIKIIWSFGELTYTYVSCTCNFYKLSLA